MEYQAIVIDDSGPGKKAELTLARKTKKANLVTNGESSSHAHSPYLHSKEIGEYQVPEAERNQQEKKSEQDEAEFQYSFNLIERRLEESRQLYRQEDETSTSLCIFRFPHGLIGINDKAQHPEIVSIGPYHRGNNRLLKFEDHKWSFLDKLISRTTSTGRGLSFYLTEMRALEAHVRDCYADVVLMSSHDFVEMMLLDSCFVVELLRHLGHSDTVIDEDDPIFTKPWLIPILIRDLLKLENQIPYIVLESVIEWSQNPYDLKVDDLPFLALTVLDLAFPRPIIHKKQGHGGNYKHLLHLFYSSLVPSSQTFTPHELDQYRPSNQSIQCITRLQPSGIKFRSSKAESFLDIKFENRVLKIPTITINDFTSTLLINCVAWEQYQDDNRYKYFTDYVSFMNCLIYQPRDVAFLCADGIITRCSQDDLYVANLFNNLGKNVVFNVRNCYLSKQFSEVEAYYSSNWATMMRTYFSSPWSFISVFSAFIIIALTTIQTIMSVLSYTKQSK